MSQPRFKVVTRLSLSDNQTEAFIVDTLRDNAYVTGPRMDTERLQAEANRLNQEQSNGNS